MSTQIGSKRAASVATPPEQRTLSFVEAVREATDHCLAADPAVYVVGEGVPDPKGIFGTTLGLQAKHGPQRVMDMPLSEDGMTGIAIGSAITGMRPVMVPQRLDFALLATNQIVNNAAKWHYMFGGQMRVPIVIRMVVGCGWGQGAQHSQSLQAWYSAHPRFEGRDAGVSRGCLGSAHLQHRR